MQRVEPIVVGQHYIRVVVQQKRQHVVPLFANGIVQRCVTFRILQRRGELLRLCPFKEGHFRPSFFFRGDRMRERERLISIKGTIMETIKTFFPVLSFPFSINEKNFQQE